MSWRGKHMFPRLRAGGHVLVYDPERGPLRRRIVRVTPSKHYLVVKISDSLEMTFHTFDGRCDRSAVMYAMPDTPENEALMRLQASQRAVRQDFEKLLAFIGLDSDALLSFHDDILARLVDPNA